MCHVIVRSEEQTQVALWEDAAAHSLGSEAVELAVRSASTSQTLHDGRRGYLLI